MLLGVEDVFVAAALSLDVVDIGVEVDPVPNNPPTTPVDNELTAPVPVVSEFARATCLSSRPNIESSQLACVRVKRTTKTDSSRS